MFLTELSIMLLGISGLITIIKHQLLVIKTYKLEQRIKILEYFSANF